VAVEILPDVVLEITTHIGCRVQCRFCPQPRLARAYAVRPNRHLHAMPLDLFQRCIDKLPLFVDVDFAGFAEPWLNPQCGAMLRYALERGHALRIHTTLQGVNAADVALFRRIPPARLKHFSLHLPSGDAGLERYRIDDTYLATLESVFASGLTPELVYHGTRIEPRVAERLAALGVPLPPAAKTTHTRAGNVDLTRYDALRNRPAPPRLHGSLGCRRPGWRVLLPNGDVTLCCMDTEMQRVARFLDIEARADWQLPHLNRTPSHSISPSRAVAPCAAFTREQFQRVMREIGPDVLALEAFLGRKLSCWNLSANAWCGAGAGTAAHNFQPALHRLEDTGAAPMASPQAGG